MTLPRRCARRRDAPRPQLLQVHACGLRSGVDRTVRHRPPEDGRRYLLDVRPCRTFLELTHDPGVPRRPEAAREFVLGRTPRRRLRPLLSERARRRVPDRLEVDAGQVHVLQQAPHACVRAFFIDQVLRTLLVDDPEGVLDLLDRCGGHGRREGARLGLLRLRLHRLLLLGRQLPSSPQDVLDRTAHRRPPILREHEGDTFGLGQRRGISCGRVVDDVRQDDHDLAATDGRDRLGCSSTSLQLSGVPSGHLQADPLELARDAALGEALLAADDHRFHACLLGCDLLDGCKYMGCLSHGVLQIIQQPVGRRAPLVVIGDLAGLLPDQMLELPPCAVDQVLLPPGDAPVPLGVRCDPRHTFEQSGVQAVPFQVRGEPRGRLDHTVGDPRIRPGGSVVCVWRLSVGVPIR